MKKFLAAIGKKNIIIISGILLIGVAVYLNLTLNSPFNSNSILDNDIINEEPESEKILGQAALVNNMNLENVNLVSDPDTVAVNAAIEEENYFAVAVVNRQRARDEALELLQSIVDTAEALPDSKESALNSISDIAADIEKEANIETIIKAKGFANCVAVVTGENANVIVKTDGLLPNEVAQIKEVVFEQAGIMPSNVKIIEKN